MTDHTTSPAIRVRGLRRSYRVGAEEFEAVRGVDLEVAPGSITALLGTNGAGKTSTLEIIEGLAAPSAGTVEVLGLDPLRDRAEVRRRTGVLLQSSGFSGDLTVTETLQMWHATLTAPRPVAQMLELLDLGARAEARVLSLSGGERRRLDLACALMGGPELILLDEPTTGLDPESRRDVWRLLEQLRADGATLLITTHYLEEAEALADHLLIMHAGRIVREGSVADLAEGHPSRVSFATPAAAMPAFPGDIVVENGTTVIETHDLQRTLGEVLRWADDAGVRLERLDAATASLESVFLAIAATPATPEPVRSGR